MGTTPSPRSSRHRRGRALGTYHPAVNETWDRSAPGILCLPSGRLVRGRALSRPLPDGPIPAFGVYLLGRRPPAVPWESRWLRWPDFRLPADEADMWLTLTEAWRARALRPARGRDARCAPLCRPVARGAMKGTRNAIGHRRDHRLRPRPVPGHGPPIYEPCRRLGAVGYRDVKAG